MRHFSYALFALCLCAVPCVGYLPSSETVDFLGSMSTNRRAMLASDEITAICGTVLATNTQNLSIEDFVENFLDANAEALGVPGMAYEYVSIKTIRNGKFDIWRFRQKIGTTPVLDSYIKVLVLRSDPEKISYVGARLAQIPNPVPQSTLSASQARDTLMNSSDWAHLDSFDAATSAVDGFFEMRNMTVHRVWRMRGWDEDEHYEFSIDAGNAEVVDVYSLISGYSGPITAVGQVELCCHPGATRLAGMLPFI